MAGQPSNQVPAMTTYQPLERPVVVIGPQFLAQCPVDLTIASRLMAWEKDDYRVTDVNGNIIFRVNGRFFSIHVRRHLQDAAGNTLVTLRQQIRTMHNRWQVFRGDSTEEKDILFGVKRSKLFQLKTQLDVFLASNTSESVPDFKVKGSWSERSCTIYLGESNTMIAQIYRRHNVKTALFGRDKFTVTIYPNVDYTFIVALVVLLDEINSDSS